MLFYYASILVESRRSILEYVLQDEEILVGIQHKIHKDNMEFNPEKDINGKKFKKKKMVVLNTKYDISEHEVDSI